MAESLPLEGKSIEQSSDNVLDIYCEPCYDLDSVMKPVAGYCKDCGESLCLECFNVHLRPKPFRNHHLVNKSSLHSANRKQQRHTQARHPADNCPRHHDEAIRSFCQTHSEICCKVCISVYHQSCDTEEIVKLAQHVDNSQELNILNKQLSNLKNGFTEIVGKIEDSDSTIQKNYTGAITEMNKLKKEFDKLMTKTVNQAAKIQEDDMKKMESISTTCNVVIEQINKIASNLDLLQSNKENEPLFISMKKAEGELQALKASLEKLGKEIVIKEYKFEPDVELKAMMSDLNALGHLIFHEPTSDTAIVKRIVSLSEQLKKTPTYVKDMKVSDTSLKEHGTIVLPNNHILITDGPNKKLKLIDTSNDKIISELQLSGTPYDVTQTNTDKVAVLLKDVNKILFVSLYNNSLAHQGDIILNGVNGDFRGIAYNDKAKSFILALVFPVEVAMVNMLGTVIGSISTDSKGENLFSDLRHVAMKPDMSGVYVVDYGAWTSNGSVTLLKINGDVEAVYSDSKLVGPVGICVNNSGLVYVVGYWSNTLHQLNPESGKFKVLLDDKDGLCRPGSISYCDEEDKIYVGMENDSILKVYQMN